LQIRIREDLRERLADAAARHKIKVSLNSEIARRLEESFDAIPREEHAFLVKSLLRDMRTLIDKAGNK